MGKIPAASLRHAGPYVGLPHGLINYKDTKTKCRLYWYLIEFIVGDTVSHVGIFDLAL
jgi:hypothetical protein